MIAMAKAQPGKLSYGTFAFPAQAFMDGLNKTEHTDIVRVPYKGGGEVVNAVLSGNTPIAVLALSNMVSLNAERPHHAARSGVQSALAACFPNSTTLQEVRPGATLRPSWFGLWTQTGVPRPIVEKVAVDRRPHHGHPALQKRMYIDRGVEPASERLEAFAQFVRDERKLAAPDRQGVRAGAEVTDNLTLGRPQSFTFLPSLMFPARRCCN